MCTISFLSSFSIHENRWGIQAIYIQTIYFIPLHRHKPITESASASISRPPRPQRFCSSRCAPIRLRIDPIPAARRRQDSSKNFCDHIVCCAAEGRRERIICCFRQSLSTALTWTWSTAQFWRENFCVQNTRKRPGISDLSDVLHIPT